MISLILASYKRHELLDLGLHSIIEHNNIPNNLEVIVINDGVHDGTAEICEKYRSKLHIRYIFSGHRNLDGKMKFRVPGFPNNIAIKKCRGDKIVLSCPEIWHLNDGLSKIIAEIKPKTLVIPEYLHFDETGDFTQELFNDRNAIPDFNKLVCGRMGTEGAQMPFLLGMMKNDFLEIGGYDEQFTGYACEDSDLMFRLQDNGCKYQRLTARIIHLYHGKHNDSKTHFDNPEYKYNWDLLQKNRGVVVRNVGVDWGVL